MRDLIDRQAAIDAMSVINDGICEQQAIDALCKLPTAQPEIIRCKDCKHMQEDKIFHQCWCNGNEVKPDHFCGYAERGENGK